MGDRVLALQDLKTYLKNVKDLEVICYQQARLVNTLKQIPGITQKEIADLEDKSEKLDMDIQITKDFQRPFERVADTFRALGMSLLYGVIVGLIGGAVGFVIWLISLLFGSGASISTFLFWGVIIGFALTFIILEIVFERENSHAVKSLPKELDGYNEQKQEVMALLASKKANLTTSIPIAISEAEKHYQQSLNNLDMYYKAGVIYPKYRGIVPVTTIYEYIESGRCTVLEGHEGAYNLYENELRMNLIIGKLDDISSKLDQIADNQRLLVQEIQESNRKMDAISQSVYSSLDKLDEIGNNTELSAYYSRISASNTSYMAWLDFLNS